MHTPAFLSNPIQPTPLKRSQGMLKASHRKEPHEWGHQNGKLLDGRDQSPPLDHHNWVHLHPGDGVIVKRYGCEPEHGTVDIVSEDATYFWVWIDGQTRIVIFHGDGSVIHKILS